MAEHFPFLGKGKRYGGAHTGIAAFFEHHGLGVTLQEKYYRWWYEWAKNFVQRDPDLSVTKAVEFNRYPYGQHAFHNFHLRDKMWGAALADLGDFIREVVLPRMDDAALHQLEREHDAMFEALEEEAEQTPRPPVPEVGHFRHV